MKVNDDEKNLSFLTILNLKALIKKRVLVGYSTYEGRRKWIGRSDEKNLSFLTISNLSIDEKEFWQADQHSVIRRKKRKGMDEEGRRCFGFPSILSERELITLSALKKSPPLEHLVVMTLV